MKTGSIEPGPGRIVGLETCEGLVWAGEDVVAIGWDVHVVPVDEHGSTATVHGYRVEMDDGSSRFIPGHKILRIFRANSASPGDPEASR